MGKRNCSVEVVKEVDAPLIVTCKIEDLLAEFDESAKLVKEREIEKKMEILYLVSKQKPSKMLDFFQPLDKQDQRPRCALLVNLWVVGL